METKKLNYLIIIGVICFALFQWSCNGDNTDLTNNNDTSVVSNNKTELIISSPKNLAVFTIGEKISTAFEIPGGLKPDSVSVYLNGKKQNDPVSLVTDSAKAGNNRVIINAWVKGVEYTNGVSVILRSNIVPQQYTYKILKRYPHDQKYYTQGLIFEDGFMYEGTGQYGESMLLKYKLANNELIQSYNLPQDVFGEGIVIFKNHIYQLTWQSHVAYEYEKETFKLINKFDFGTEGWGITNFNENLIMSDGSYNLYVLSPESFSEIKRIEVYDNIGPVSMLNELELINGEIYANVYQTDNIVIVNPNTGCVTGKIDLSGLLDKTKIKDRDVDVLNGIAWDVKGKRLFLTGKYWPEMYEVQIVKK
ncbi:MAG: glutaminyl-peptide cyclotransferase [Bacteroidia bacterium]|nr:glutaminyl-peptide cyclotransferase [Bacteroidia bacterium]